jgi:adenosine kinase
MSSHPQLIGICNPLLDISAVVEPDFLTKYDLKGGNAILAEEKHLPLYVELVKNYPVQYIAGGAGQNSIRAAQFMLQKEATTGYLGCIGNDENGKRLREEATKDGVHVHYMVDPNTPTGTCAVLIVKRERSLVANLAAANCYKKDHFDSQEIQTLIQNAKFYYVTGFFLTVSPETIVALGKHAATNNKVMTFNLSAPFLIDFFYDRMQSVLPFVDVLFGNEVEFAAFGTKNGWGTDLKVIAQKASELTKENTRRGRVVVVTCGKNPTIIFDPVVGKPEEIEVPLVPKEEIVDVNGAGDSFVGGFMAGLVQGWSYHLCVKSGNYCAGVTIRTSGTDFKGKTPSFIH